LPGDAGLERGANAAVKRAQLVFAQLAGRPERMDARAPERLVVKAGASGSPPSRASRYGSSSSGSVNSQVPKRRTSR